MLNVGLYGEKERRRKRQARLETRVAVLREQGMDEASCWLIAYFLEEITAAYHRRQKSLAS